MPSRIIDSTRSANGSPSILFERLAFDGDATVRTRRPKVLAHASYPGVSFFRWTPMYRSWPCTRWPTTSIGRRFEVRGLRSFFALEDVDEDPLSLAEVCDAGPRKRRGVYKDSLAAIIQNDEAKPSAGVVPLHSPISWTAASDGSVSDDDLNLVRDNLRGAAVLLSTLKTSVTSKPRSPRATRNVSVSPGCSAV